METPAYVVTLPLYLLSFTILILGVAVGGIVGWFTQGKRHRYRRRLEAELNRMRAELDRAMREKATHEAALRGMRATATTVPARLPASYSGRMPPHISCHRARRDCAIYAGSAAGTARVPHRAHAGPRDCEASI